MEAPDMEERSDADKAFEFTQLPVRIGRGANNNISLTDPTRTISRNHARIFLEDESLKIEDLESKNFTYLNNEQLTPFEPFDLRDGDVIQCGDFVLQVFLKSDSTVFDLQDDDDYTANDTRALEEDILDNPFDDIVADLLTLLDQLTQTYNEALPMYRDALLAKAITKSTQDLETSEVVHVIAESLSKTGLLRKELGIPTQEDEK